MGGTVRKYVAVEHSSTPKECSQHREEVHPGREENWNRDLYYLKIKVNPGVMMHC
jgi:hypothetical protein